MRKSRTGWIAVGCAVALLSQTGCITLLGGKTRSPKLDTSYLESAGYSIPPGGMPAPVRPTRGDGASIVMEVRGGNEKAHMEQIPLPKDRPMFIEDLVKEAKITERVGGVLISIMRPTGPNLPPVRMDVRVRETGKVKDLEDNYALMPGDHIIVNCDGRTSLEVFVDSLKS
jgi:hypothetical protein